MALERSSAYKPEDAPLPLHKRGLLDRYFRIPKLPPDMRGKELIGLFGWNNCDAPTFLGLAIALVCKDC